MQSNRQLRELTREPMRIVSNRTQGYFPRMTKVSLSRLSRGAGCLERYKRLTNKSTYAISTLLRFYFFLTLSFFFSCFLFFSFPAFSFSLSFFFFFFWLLTLLLYFLPSLPEFLPFLLVTVNSVDFGGYSEVYGIQIREEKKM